MMRPDADSELGDAAVLTDPRRLSALAESHLLDSLPEESFDRFVRMAMRLTGSPTGTLTLVTGDRQFFKSQYGVGEPWSSLGSSPLSHSLCQYVVTRGAPLQIDNGPSDARFREHPAITESKIHAYLGVPLRWNDQVIGSLCVISDQSRQWSDDDQRVLEDLVAAVHTELELRRAIEHQLQQNLRLLALSEALPAIVYGFDFQTEQLTFLNQSGRRLLGPERAFHSLADVLAILHPDDVPNFARRARRVEREPQVGAEVEYRLRQTDGTYRWFLDRQVCADPEPGKSPLRQVVGVAVDIESSKQQQELLVLERNRAEEAAQRESQFIARASHELRTPLQALMGTIELLKARRAELSPAEKDRYLLVAHEGASSLLELVNRLLDLECQLEDQALEIVEFDLASQLRSLQAQFDGAAANSKSSLSLEMSSLEGQRYLGDWGRIKQVLTNLIGNALKYAPGPIRVKVAGGERIHFVVSDQGPGIPPDRQSAIFEPFVRLDAQHSSSSSGLGLPLARAMAQKLGGDLAVESHPDTQPGSRFHFRIPLERVQAAASAGPPRASGALPRWRILLVEDHILNVELLQLFLESLGQEVAVASSCAELSQALREKEFDLVLLDLNVPDGDPLVEIQPWLSQRPGLRVVAATADNSSASRQRCLQEGCVDIWIKPLTRDSLKEGLERLAATT